MLYPMVSGNLKERWEKSIEKNVGLPIDLIRKLDSTHLSFYLQNRKRMRIERNDNGKILYFVDKRLRGKISKALGIKSSKEFIFNEDEFDDYLDKVGFRGAKISTEPMMRYISSEEIDKQIDKQIDKILKND